MLYLVMKILAKKIIILRYLIITHFLLAAIFYFSFPNVFKIKDKISVTFFLSLEMASSVHQNIKESSKNLSIHFSHGDYRPLIRYIFPKELQFQVIFFLYFTPYENITNNICDFHFSCSYIHNTDKIVCTHLIIVQL